MYGNVELKSKARYENVKPIPKEKLEKALSAALDKLEKNIEIFGDKLALPVLGFDPTHPKGFSYNLYQKTDRVMWTTGTWTGLYWLAYQVSGNEKFRKVAESHLPLYLRASQNPKLLNDHDTGFKFIPSCVAAWRLTKNESARAAALLAAEFLLAHYCKHNKFIIRSGQRSSEDKYTDYRTLVDTMMNISLFFWAYEETGYEGYLEAAKGHYETTTKYLVREDGSSNHHYQFDPVTLEPVGNVTHQGNGDDSCWSRGQSWLVYGYSSAYGYTQDKSLIDAHRAVSYYFMDNLPKDGVPYWDFDFKDGSFEPRDSSASAIAACGLYDVCKYLPDDSEDKKLFKGAADLMLEKIIDTCVPENENAHCLITQVTGSRPHNKNIANCETYGDYFYLEALIRALYPDMKIYW